MSVKGRKTESHNQCQYRHRATPRGRMTFLASQARMRAIRKGLVFERDLFEHLRSNAPRYCACCGCVLDYRMGRGKNNRQESPSLDRRDNAKGYTIENVRVICMSCNETKKNLTIRDLLMLLAYMAGV
jgi:hypothetical protein